MAPSFGLLPRRRLSMHDDSVLLPLPRLLPLPQKRHRNGPPYLVHRLLLIDVHPFASVRLEVTAAVYHLLGDCHEMTMGLTGPRSSPGWSLAGCQYSQVPRNLALMHAWKMWPWYQIGSALPFSFFGTAQPATYGPLLFCACFPPLLFEPRSDETRPRQS
jgi:hypothetical protein